MRGARVATAAALFLLATAPHLRAGAKPVFGDAPFDGGGSSPHRIEVSVDFSAAQQILEALSADKFPPGEASRLLSLPAVRRQIRSSGRDESQWVEDFATAYAETSRPEIFDLRSIRLDRTRWTPRLAGLSAEAPAMEKAVAARVASLLPGDAPVALKSRVEMSFGVAGLADHLVFHEDDRAVLTVVDLARALAAYPDAGPAQLSEALTRLAAGETYRVAWAAYRARAAGWSRPAGLGPIEPLAEALAVQAPIDLYSFDRNFFPLSRWLKEPMMGAIDAFNREADLLLDPKTELDRRAELLADLRSGRGQRDPGLSAGAFVADGIYENLGRQALLDALASGPRAFLEAYDRAASRKRSELPPLVPKLREILRSGRASGG
jgi:hypothetical protein